MLAEGNNSANCILSLSPWCWDRGRPRLPATHHVLLVTLQAGTPALPIQSSIAQRLRYTFHFSTTDALQLSNNESNRPPTEAKDRVRGTLRVIFGHQIANAEIREA